MIPQLGQPVQGAQPGQVDPQQQMIQLAQALGIGPQQIQGYALGLGLEELMKKLQPKQPKQPAGAQAGGQTFMNKQVQGAGPLRSGTTPDQLTQLVQLILSSPQFSQQLPKMPNVPSNMPSPVAGIPGVPGPTFG